MGNTNFIYGKDESKIIAGIAIILMLYHHFFGFPSFLLSDTSFYQVLIYKDISVERVLASFGKICVAIFAFNTGYSLYVNSVKSNFVRVLNRTISFLIKYWIICILFMAFAIITSDELPSMNVFFKNIVGISTGPEFSYVNVCFAWYVIFYIMIMLFSPVLKHIFRFKKIGYDIIVLVLMYVILINCSEYINSWLLNVFIVTGVNSFWGYLFAKWELFSKLNSLLNCRIFILVLIVILCILLRPIAILYTGKFPFDLLFVPLLIYSVLSLLGKLNSNKLNRFFLFLGKHSMNLWFIHSIFFTGKKICQPLLYFPYYSPLILLWGLCILIPICMIVSKFQNIMISYLPKIN